MIVSDMLMYLLNELWQESVDIQGRNLPGSRKASRKG